MLRNLLLFATLTAALSAQGNKTFPLASYVPANGPGVVALVADRGQIIYTGATGYANIEKRTAMKTDYVFNMASVSKHFTAMAVLMLEGEGKIKATDAITKYIPELPAYAKKVSVRHLVHHQGGLPDYEGICGSDDQPMTNQAVIDYLKTTKKPLFAPGKKYQYSNTGYALLAVVVERASGMDFAAFMRDRIFQPLGMKATYVLNPASLPTYQKRQVLGYYESWREGPYVFSGCDTLYGDGSVISNIFDLAKWIQALHERKLIGEAQMKIYLKPVTAKGGSEYAYGLERYDDDGEISFSHAGSWGGFISYVIYYPQRAAYIVVISNYDGFDYAGISDALYEKFLSK